MEIDLIVHCLNKSGNLELKLSLLCQGSVQNCVLAPSPMLNWTEASKRALTELVIGRGKPRQGLAVSIQESHNHLHLIDSLFWSRQGIPRPPNFLGKHTCFQLTRHLPPVASSLFAQRNPLHPLSNFLTAQRGGSMAKIWKIGKAYKTEVIRASRPAVGSISLFQPEVLRWSLSKIG